MRLKITLLAGFTIPLLLSGCGGGNADPYDGTWTAVYPALSKDSIITAAKIVTCTNTGTSIVIKNSAGTTRITATCKIDLFDTSTIPPTSTSTSNQSYFADVGVNIVAKKAVDQQDVMNAFVNGVTFTGTCISTAACSAVSAAGDTLSLTR